jgi:lipopolysaccharide/colanic/teichoic acid biosynthesis glycosyltransferase
VYKQYLKHILDFLLALFTFIVLLPFFIIVIVLLKVANQGAGIFFFQERTGKNAELFKIIKFKTMRDDRDSDGNLLPDSARMTPIGKFVRSTSLDELPQILNVLKGEMSLIGPRPLLKKYVPLYSDEQFKRHLEKPGITGWAQVNGRNNITWKKKFELDVWYVDNVSFILDIKILWLTLKKVIARKDIVSADPADFQPFNGNN